MPSIYLFAFFINLKHYILIEQSLSSCDCVRKKLYKFNYKVRISSASTWSSCSTVLLCPRKEPISAQHVYIRTRYIWMNLVYMCMYSIAGGSKTLLSPTCPYYSMLAIQCLFNFLIYKPFRKRTYFDDCGNTVRPLTKTVLCCIHKAFNISFSVFV